MMAAQPLVYVHGAGVQAPAPAMKHELDILLFGRDMSTTRVAHYADVRWPPAGGGQRSVGPERSGRTRRSRAIGAATKPGVSSKTAAAVLLGATLATPSPARGQRDRTRGVARGSEEPTAPPADAFHLVEQLYRRADRVATHSAAPRASAERGLGFPDPIFRWVVGRFASDVIDYLFNGYSERMRQPVRDALLNGPPPAVIVAHSLGTIVTYDVLAEPAFAGLQVHLITLGCPLGIGNVQERLRDGVGRPNPVPPSVIAWANFADSWDPVAIDPTLHDEFTPKERSAKDDRVNNPARNNHDLNGYLSVAMVRSTIVTAAG